MSDMWSDRFICRRRIYRVTTFLLTFVWLPETLPDDSRVPTPATGLRASLGKLSDGESLAFAARVDGNLDIYVLTKTELTRLTEDRANDEAPCWSPDGSRLAFASKRSGKYQIYTMGYDGRDVRRLTDDPEFANLPAWSPDGKTIAFLSLRGLAKESPPVHNFFMDSDGANVRPLPAEGSSGRVAWSPDGKRIALVMQRGNLLEKVGGWRSALDLVRLDGTAATRLARSPDVDLSGPPAWSPDGRTIAYALLAPPPNEAERSDRSAQIHLIDADGTHPRQLTSLKGRCGFPAWSPNGRKIGFNAYPSKSDFNAKGSIYVIDADGSNMTRITSEDVDAFEPAWRPGVK